MRYLLIAWRVIVIIGGISLVVKGGHLFSDADTWLEAFKGLFLLFAGTFGVLSALHAIVDSFEN